MAAWQLLSLQVAEVNPALHFYLRLILYPDFCRKNVKQPSPIKKGLKFDMSEIDCAYYESGVFDTESVSGECPDPFMTEGERPLPTCSDSCCEADLPGSWCALCSSGSDGSPLGKAWRVSCPVLCEVIGEPIKGLT